MAEHVPTTPAAPPHGVPIPSRRALFGGAAALAAIATVSGSAAAPSSPDSALVEIADRIVAASAETDAIWRPFEHSLEGGPTLEEQARSEALVDEGHDLAERLANIPALTLVGLQAKARALLEYSGYDEVSLAVHGFWWNNHDELLGWSLARDLLAARAGE